MALTINVHAAIAAPVGATPCASAESVTRAVQALELYMRRQGRPMGMVLLDCRVQASQRLRCSASRHTQSKSDIGAAAVAYANELEVCPGTPRHLLFPLVFRADEVDARR